MIVLFCRFLLTLQWTSRYKHKGETCLGGVIDFTADHLFFQKHSLTSAINCYHFPPLFCTHTHIQYIFHLSEFICEQIKGKIWYFFSPTFDLCHSFQDKSSLHTYPLGASLEATDQLAQCVPCWPPLNVSPVS